MSSIFAWVKRTIKRIWDNIVEAVSNLTEPVTVVHEDGTTTVENAPLTFISQKVAAVVVVAAGLFFVLFPFESAAAITFGDQLIRMATLMWNGAT
jgi:hypothetical protein